MYTYIHMYIYICVCIYICIRICVHIYVSLYYAHIYTWIDTHLHIDSHVYIYMYKHDEHICTKLMTSPQKKIRAKTQSNSHRVIILFLIKIQNKTKYKIEN